ncbi:PAS domain S-box protein [Desertivirga brevis]|uniref:PAS domain S-box protein n=1 Tax=Desertivirga brevis TaxID=2810310 RepID=UPI001A9790CF|nr:PAS domain S-box protein [Pedobacter sp. SYSU D00873]
MDYKSLKIVVLYLVAALAWIILSDQVLKLAAAGMTSGELSFWQSVKGVGFVLFTAFILYSLVKKNNENLATSERQYRELFTGNPSPMWIYNLSNYRFVEVNQSAIEKYGYSRDEFLKMTVLDIRPEKDRAAVIEFIKKIQNRQGNSGYWTHRKRSGEELSASIKSFPVTFNGQECAMVLAIDITERINQQRQLEESYRKEIELNEALATHIDLIKQSNEEKRRMGEIIEKINNFVIIAEINGDIRWANKAFLQFSQYTMSEIMGKSAQSVLISAGNQVDAVASLLSALNNQQFFSAEICGKTKAGEEYWVQTDISPIYDEEGKLDCYIAVQTLITERKQREEKIQQQNKTLRQLAWVSSHELRKPVSSIISLINILKDTEDGPEKLECMRLLEDCANELDNLVKDITKKVNVAEGEQPLV